MIVIVWPATPIGGDSVIPEIVTVNDLIAKCVPSVPLTVCEPAVCPVTVNLTFAGNWPVAVVVTVAGVVVIGVPSSVNVTTCDAVKLEPDIVTEVPLGPDDGASVSADVTVNVVVGLLIPSVTVTV